MEFSPQGGNGMERVSSDEGKHSLRLYAGRVSGRCPVPQPPKGESNTERRSAMREKRKTELVTLRVTPYTKQVLKERAAAARMTLTDYLCICGLGKQIVRVDGLDEVLHELKAQGRNLNQLTTLANMGKLKVLRGDDLAEGYAKLCEQVGQFTKAVT